MTGISTFGHAMPARPVSINAESSVFDSFVFPEDFPPEYKPMLNDCLIAKARPSEKVGSILLPERTKDEDATLSQIGKIMAVGPLFYQLGSARNVPEADRPKVGDYVYYGAYIGNRVALRNMPDSLFILIADHEIKMRIDSLEAVSNLKLFA